METSLSKLICVQQISTLTTLFGVILKQSNGLKSGYFIQVCMLFHSLYKKTKQFYNKWTKLSIVRIIKTTSKYFVCIKLVNDKIKI